MMITMEEAVSLLKQHDKILILTHCNPDGDTLGCGYALCRGLRQMGKRARVVNSDVIGAKYAYLFQDMADDQFEEEYVVAVDIATQQLLGEPLLSRYSGKIKLCIDHHGSNTDYAEKTLLDDTAGAACEIIYEILRGLGVSIDQKIANCLYTGLSTDTGCFKYENATSRTYHIAADMIDCGAESGMINRVMFDTKTKTYARLERMALDTLRLYFNERCAVMEITQEMYEKSGSNEMETDALASIPRQIEGVLVGITIRQKADGTCKASVRSREGFNASDLCRTLGGGGHVQAAACAFAPGIEMEQAKQMLLEQVQKMLPKE